MKWKKNENEDILQTCLGEMTIYNKTYGKDYKLAMGPKQ